MKKILVSLLIILSALLCSCADNPENTPTSESTSGTSAPITETVIAENANYSVVSFGNRHCISIKKEPSGLVRGSVIFDSLREMKDSVINGKLTEEQLMTVASFEKNEDGSIKICDMQKLYAPKAPAGFEVSKVTWSGETYAFILQNNGIAVSLTYLTEDGYNAKYEESKSFADNKNITVQKTENIAERNAVATYYTTSVASIKKLTYDIKIDDTVLHIEEEYILEIKNNVLETSETVPHDISVYGENKENGTRFFVYVSDLAERPSIEWLSCFDMEAYKE